jgi:hypothetical protein
MFVILSNNEYQIMYLSQRGVITTILNGQKESSRMAANFENILIVF